MKTHVTTLVDPIIVSCQPLLARRCEATRQALALSLMRPKDETPMASLLAITLGLALGSAVSDASALSSPKTDGLPDLSVMLELPARCQALADEFRSIAFGLEMLARQEKIKLSQMLMNREALTTYILQKAQVGSGVTPTMIVDMLLQGDAAGPRGSELDVLRSLGVWAGLRSASGIKAGDIQSLHASATVCRFHETCIKYLDDPAFRRTQDPRGLSNEETVRQLTTSLRHIALTLISAPLAAARGLMAHYHAVIQHPWIRHAIDEQTLISIDEHLRFIDSENLMSTAWSNWPELTKMEVWDLAMIQPYYLLSSSTLQDGVLPPRTASLDTMAEYPLFADIVAPVNIVPNGGVALLNAIKQLAAIARSYDLNARAILESDSPPVQYGGHVLDLSLPSHADVREPRTISDARGYPIATPYDVWSPGPRKDLTAITKLGFSRYNFYTTAEVAEAASASYREWQPVKIAGSPEVGVARALDVRRILPAIDGWTDDGLYLPPTLQSLVHLWGTSVAELQRTLLTLPSDVNSPWLRAYADKFRFVGVVALLTNDVVQLVRPHVHHWYHSDMMREHKRIASAVAAAAKISAGATIDGSTVRLGQDQTIWGDGGPQPILLGNLSKESTKLFMVPFASVPSSCCITEAGRFVELPYFAVLPKASLLRWTGSQKLKPLWPINGWVASQDDEFADIVGVPAPHELSGYFEIQGSSQVRPSFAARPNGVVTFSDMSESVPDIALPTVASAIDAEYPIE